MTQPDPEDSEALSELSELYRDGMEEPSSAELDRGLDAILGRVAGGRTRGRAVRWSLLAAALVVAVAVAVPVTSLIRARWFSTEPPLLAYQIAGGRVLEGGYLRESGSAGVSLHFNDGSNVALTPGTRGRIREVDREGARVAIEHGTAAFQITHGAGRRWLVDVGPFLVTVKGTVFTVAWEPLSEQFELRLERGRVTVSGPVSAGEITLRAGQRLTVNLARAETVITEDAAGGTGAESGDAGVPEPTSAPAPSSTEGNPALETTPSTASAPPPAGKLGGERRWSDELAHGQWDRILAEAERTGLETTLGTASSEDLLALADAARYRRRLDLARSALLAERRRFPGSPRSLDAIYLLGRVEESRASGLADALAWYDQYLARAPNGPFAGEALGRKLTLTDKLLGAARARPVAEEYLRRFPHGSYAGSARALLSVQ
jgi:TolA-binding protein